MKLYYHKTTGGAEYYCLKAVEGTEEGDMSTAIIRTDGGEIEILSPYHFSNNNVKLVINWR